MPVSISISGLPDDCYEIKAAYVWWIVSYRTGSSRTPTVTVRNPINQNRSYDAFLTGEEEDKCWNEEGTRGFRANIKEIISGNGTYNISVSTPQWETDGLTLLIIYKDHKADYEGHLAINDGLITKQSQVVTETI